jgi:hypothetical protein
VPTARSIALAIAAIGGQMLTSAAPLALYIPVSSDLPMIEPVMVDVAKPNHPVGRHLNEKQGMPTLGVQPSITAPCRIRAALRREDGRACVLIQVRSYRMEI